jgi:DNA invertase Pin-like site-specific DNA recombinase
MSWQTQGDPSGRSVMRHPEAKRMLGDIKSGQITGLIFSKLARLARNTKELLEFADFFQMMEHITERIAPTTESLSLSLTCHPPPS